MAVAPKTPEDPFWLQTLGEVTLSDTSGRPTKLRTRKALFVLACLAAKPAHTWTRDRLATLFWADRQEEQARNSLRTALSDIRRVLGSDALVIDGTSVRLAPGFVATDIARLRTLASADSGPDPGELSGFYGGDFLSEVDNAGDSANWIVSLRATCRELAAAILEKSISTVAKSDSADVAILRARELVSLDPLNEKSHRILIRLYADDGQRSKAIAQFQSCRQMLQLELGVEPSAETIRLADDVAVRSASALSDLKEIATTRNQTESATATMSTPGPTPASDGGDVSLAVLPFVNMSGDADQDYFAAGVSEDIATDLSKVANLSVAGASSSRPYRAAGMRPDEIAAELGVRYLLEGSVRRSDENVRITTRLIEGRNNRQIWAERYDRELVNVFEVQSEIAANVANAVELQVAPDVVGPTPAPSTSSPEAHEYYLRGRALLKEMTRRSVELSKQSFEQAIALDGNYALAFAGLAESISMLAFHYEAAEPLLDSAVGHCRTALKLDPGLAEAHCSLGRFHSVFRRLEDSEAEFSKAIEISPNLVEAHYYRGISNLAVGRAEKAILPLRRAFELDPKDLQIGMMLINCEQALTLTDERKVTAENVLRLARRRMALNPYDDQAAYVGAFALSALGETTEAILWANVAAAYDIDDARSIYNIACLFSVLGEFDQALALLGKALDLGMPERKRIWI
ncbi:MAG: tetratricopeptide repeat protein, partial [Hyphomicrobiales bacterium]|nr:tetratricopeptide repeat protein [Hyphomicrobiales bacterium]